MAKELKIGDNVYCYTMDDRSVWGGLDNDNSHSLRFYGYFGKIDGIRVMSDGRVYYTIIASEVNLHSGEIARVPLLKPIEVRSSDCYTDIKKLKKEIYRYIDMVDRVLKS